MASIPLRRQHDKGQRPSPSAERSHRGLVWLLIGLLVVAGGMYLARRDRTAARSPAPPLTPSSQQDAASAASPKPTETLPQAMPPEPVPPRQRNLHVIAATPTSRTFNYRDTPIAVTFSHPVNPETVPPAFKVTPPIPGGYSFPAPNQLVFTPQGFWDLGATYLVTLEEGITDLSGLDHLEPMRWDFSIVGGYFYTRDVSPLVKTHCASCHRAGGPAARIRLDTLADVKQFVKPGSAEASRFVTALTDSNHQGRLAQAALAKVYLFRDWITVFQAGD